MSSRNIDRCYFPLLYLKHVFATITEQTEENDQCGDTPAAPSCRGPLVLLICVC